MVKTQNTTQAQEWRITFQGSLAGANQNQVTVDSSGVSAMGPKTNIQATDVNGAPSGTDEVQTVTLSNATGGTFRLAFMGQTAAPLAYNATAAEVESTLEALQAVDNVTVTGSAGLLVATGPSPLRAATAASYRRPTLSTSTSLTSLDGYVPASQQLAGYSASTGFGVNGAVVGAGLGVSNLNPAAAMANCYGAQPTVVNLSVGYGPSAEPVEGGVMYGDTWADSVSVATILVYAEKMLYPIYSW